MTEDRIREIAEMATGHPDTPRDVENILPNIIADAIRQALAEEAAERAAAGKEDADGNP